MRARPHEPLLGAQGDGTCISNHHAVNNRICIHVGARAIPKVRTRDKHGGRVKGATRRARRAQLLNGSQRQGCSGGGKEKDEEAEEEKAVA